MRGNPRIIVRVDADILAQLRRLSSFYDVSLSEVVRHMIDTELDKDQYKEVLGRTKP